MPLQLLKLQHDHKYILVNPSSSYTNPNISYRTKCTSLHSCNSVGLTMLFYSTYHHNQAVSLSLSVQWLCIDYIHLHSSSLLIVHLLLLFLPIFSLSLYTWSSYTHMRLHLLYSPSIIDAEQHSAICYPNIHTPSQQNSPLYPSSSSCLISDCDILVFIALDSSPPHHPLPRESNALPFITTAEDDDSPASRVHFHLPFKTSTSNPNPNANSTWRCPGRPFPEFDKR